MKLLSATLAFAACLPLALAHRKGFNIAAQRPDGNCKGEGDWEDSFRHMKKIPGGFDQVRVYASSDCDTLERAVPAAKKTGVKILVGVWATDSAHYEAEKKALLKAAKKHGTDWISSISVGSEDLYRKDIDPQLLADHIYDVRGMMTTVKGGKGKPVGHVDTWNAWVKDENAVVIKAADFIGMDDYPYYQNSDIKHASHVFLQALAETKMAVRKHSKGTPVWITETGWPVNGPKSGHAVPSKKNARYYWKHTVCPLFNKMPVFVYSLRDYNVNPDPNFGVLNSNWKPYFDLSCH